MNRQTNQAVQVTSIPQPLCDNLTYRFLYGVILTSDPDEWLDAGGQEQRQENTPVSSPFLLLPTRLDAPQTHAR